MEEEGFEEGGLAYIVDACDQVNPFQIGEGELGEAPKVVDSK